MPLLRICANATVFIYQAELKILSALCPLFFKILQQAPSPNVRIMSCLEVRNRFIMKDSSNGA